MGRRSDIRRIGAIMRHGGADGSLVAWVEAELDRVDFADPVPGCLSTLVDDLTAHERQLIVAALMTVALEGPKVRPEGVDAAVRIGRELGIDVAGVERILRDVSGWSMQQARELARRKLPASTSPAALAEARRHAQDDPSMPLGERDTLPDHEGATEHHGGSGPASQPLLDEIHFELPELTESFSGGLSTDTTDPVSVWPTQPDPTASARRTERMDHLADAVRRLDDAPEEDAEEDPLGDDPPTVEMTPDAVRALLQRKAKQREALESPPRFSRLGEAVRETSPPAEGPTTHASDEQDDLDATHSFAAAPPAEPAADAPSKPLKPVPLDQGLQDLPPLDWGEGDAFTVNDFTLSERLAGERFDGSEDPSDDEPTQFVQMPREVKELLARKAAKPRAGALPPPTAPSEPQQRAPDPTMDLDPDSDEAPEPQPSPADEPPRARHGASQAPNLDDIELDADFLEPPPGDAWAKHDPHSTAELLELDLDEAPATAFDRALRTTASLPKDPDPSEDLHTGEGLRAAPREELQELSLDPEEPELSLDPDTGDRIAVAGSRAVHWSPPDTDPPAAGGLPIPEEDDVLTPDLQPLEESLAAYWAPQPLHQSDGLTGELRRVDDEEGGLTGELRVVDPGDVQGGLTGELRVLDAGDIQGMDTGDLDLIDPGDVQGGLTGELRAVSLDDFDDGLTGELRAVPEEGPEKGRPRRRRRGSEGLTQDLTLLVDGDPARRKEED